MNEIPRCPFCGCFVGWDYSQPLGGYFCSVCMLPVRVKGERGFDEFVARRKAQWAAHSDQGEGT